MDTYMRSVGRSLPRLLPHILVLMLLPALMAGCMEEPARNNPADPGSPNYDGSGKVTFLVLDREDNPLSMALVRLPNLEMTSYTDNNGIAEFNTPAGSLTYIVQMNNYIEEAGEVYIESRGSFNYTVKLNGKPTIDSVFVHTSEVQMDNEISHFQYSYIFDVYVSDADGDEDVKHVKIIEPGSTIERTLTKQGPQLYRYTNVLGFQIDSLLTRIGQDFKIILRDELEDSSVTIEQISSFLHYPKLLDDILDTSPYVVGEMVFAWDNPSNDEPLFWFRPTTYRAEFFDDGAPIIDTLLVYPDSPDTFQYAITQHELFQDITSRFSWKLTLYDPFGNLVKTASKAFNPLNEQWKGSN